MALLDDFNRADGPLGGSWVDNPSPAGIVSGAMQRVSGGRGFSRWNQSFGPDCEVEWTIGAWPSGSDFIDIFVRSDTPTSEAEVSNGVYLGASGVFALSIDWGWTDAAANHPQGVYFPDTPSPGDVVRMRLVGTAASVYYNGVRVGSYDDPTMTRLGAGYIHVEGSGTGWRIDDFSGGDVAAGSASAARLLRLPSLILPPLS